MSIMSPIFIPRAQAPQKSPEEKQREADDRRKKEEAVADANTMNAAEAANQKDRRNRILFGDKAADLLSLSIPNFGAKPPVRPDDLTGSSGGSGTNSSGSGGGSGGGGVSYMPGGSPIGKGKPKAWSAPQQNFEDAKAKGQVTPDKIAQAQAFAQAHGREFDPELGYSTNKKPGFAFGTPGVPVAKLKGKPFWVGEAGPELARVKDGKLTVVPNHVIKAAGVTPPKARQAMAFAEMADGRGFADGTGVQTMEDYPENGSPPGVIQLLPDKGPADKWKPALAPIGKFGVPGLSPGQSLMLHGEHENVGSSRPAPQAAFPPPGEPANNPAQPSRSAFSPVFVPSFARTLSAPPGVRQTDFRRFLRSPQGTAFQFHQAAYDRHDANQRQDMLQRHAWEQDDKASAKAERDAAEAESSAAEDAISHALTQDGGLLTDKDHAFITATKGSKAKQQVRDTLSRLRLSEREDKAKADRENGKDVTGLDTLTAPDGSTYLPVAVHRDGTRSSAGGAYPVQKATARTPPAELLKSLGDGYEVHTMHDDGSYTIRPKATVKPASTKTMIYDAEDPSKMHPWDTSFGDPPAGWVLPSKSGETASLQQGPAVPTAANNRYFPNYKPIPLRH